MADIQPRVTPRMTELATRRVAGGPHLHQLQRLAAQSQPGAHAGRLHPDWFTIEGKLLALKKFDGGNYLRSQLRGLQPLLPDRDRQELDAQADLAVLRRVRRDRALLPVEKPLNGKEWHRQGSPHHRALRHPQARRHGQTARARIKLSVYQTDETRPAARWAFYPRRTTGTTLASCIYNGRMLIIAYLGCLRRLCAGVAGGFVGLGGGIVIIPALVYLFGYPQMKAQGTSLALMLPPIGILGFLQYWNNPKVQIDLWAAGLIARLRSSSAATSAGSGPTDRSQHREDGLRLVILISAIQMLSTTIQMRALTSVALAASGRIIPCVIPTNNHEVSAPRG